MYATGGGFNPQPLYHTFSFKVQIRPLAILFLIKCNLTLAMSPLCHSNSPLLIGLNFLYMYCTCRISSALWPIFIWLPTIPFQLRFIMYYEFLSQTDRKRRIEAHRATACTGGLKNGRDLIPSHGILDLYTLYRN